MNTLNISEAAAYLRRTVKTLQRWDRDGILVASRTVNNRRYYLLDQLNSFLNLKSAPITRSKVAYLRVSSQAQKLDLENQRRILEEFCVSSGLANVDFVEEIGGGLNFKRPKLLKLLSDIKANKVENLILAHKDRLCRFGFDLLEWLCSQHSCKILILNQERLSPENEMVQDLMTIVHCFSSRLYGLRNYRKSLRKALSASHPQNSSIPK